MDWEEERGVRIAKKTHDKYGIRRRRNNTNIPITKKLLLDRKHRPTEQETHIRIRAFEIIVRVVDALSRRGLRGRHLPTAAGAHVVLGIEEVKGQEGVARRGTGRCEEEVEVADGEVLGHVAGTVAASECGEGGWRGES